MMKWTPLTQYAQTYGEYTISKASVSGGWKYTLWRGENPGEMMGIFDSAELAKRKVENEI